MVGTGRAEARFKDFRLQGEALLGGHPLSRQETGQDRHEAISLFPCVDPAQFKQVCLLWNEDKGESVDGL